MMVKPFEEAAFKLGQNEMQVVESEFGFHVLRLTGIQGGKTRSYEEVKKEIADDVAPEGTAQVCRKPETFSNMVYEQSDSLKGVAERFKLQIQSTGWIAKSARQELGALDNPKLLSALFSSDALEEQAQCRAPSKSPNTLVAALVLKHQPAAPAQAGGSEGRNHRDAAQSRGFRPRAQGRQRQARAAAQGRGRRRQWGRRA